MTFSAHVSFPAENEDSSLLSYRLLELPPDLLKLFEEGDLPPGSLTIKGRPDDDAVLCTPTSTYAIRSIAVSNTIAVLTPSVISSSEEAAPPGTLAANPPAISEHRLVIRDQLHELLELLPAMPRLSQLDELLQETSYDDDDAVENDNGLVSLIAIWLRDLTLTI